MTIPVMPSMRLDGRRALVTGAGRGLGLAAASALAAAGAEVVLAARSPQEVSEAAAAIREVGGMASGVALDVVDLDAASAWLDQAPAFDILVNNAGTNRPAAFLDTEAADYDFVFDVNVRAAFFVAQAVARKLVRERRRGSIINMSSQMGHVGAARRTVYCATKHAVEGMTKAIAAELGEHGIRVNTICPTFIETPMTKPFFVDAAFRDFVLGKLKLGRLGVPEDIMGAVVFLASDASALMTGSALMLDSGWTTTS
ncbi:SDR family NAD(P)-dependent oxidoreductase [Burkholderia diffusa]|uniref:SDR family NAD(P)-dependent oxidoreductase n=1 Tax=Burkholderia diffusa TaxID=488732 RepID=UPI002AB144FE|nr:SDR family NAD(P)-dependent oxidoreductase [Burkholderia diffusa]